MELADFKLGETSDSFMINTRQENHDVLLQMITQAQHSLSMFSHNLDATLYDTGQYLAALKQLSLNNKHSKVRILIRDIDFITKHGHRFIELARRLPSSIEIRQTSSEYEHIITAYSIVDDRGIILRNDALRYEAKVNFNDPMLARDLLKQFNEIWNQSEPSQEMQRLHI
ncbi:MAG: hypothetical protein PVG18_12310 [Thioalkalispiraceae bacterium]|jgi:hypothetical protein